MFHSSPFCSCSWLWNKHLSLLATAPCEQQGDIEPPQGSDPIFVFQGEATQLKKDANALLSMVDMYMAQYRQLQSRTGHWEEEIKQLLQRGEGERAVRH